MRFRSLQYLDPSQLMIGKFRDSRVDATPSAKDVSLASSLASSGLPGSRLEGTDAGKEGSPEVMLDSRRAFGSSEKKLWSIVQYSLDDFLTVRNQRSRDNEQVK